MTVAMDCPIKSRIILYDMNDRARVALHNSAFYSTKCDITKATIDKTLSASVQRFRYWFIVRSLRC